MNILDCLVSPSFIQLRPEYLLYKSLRIPNLRSAKHILFYENLSHIFTKGLILNMEVLVIFIWREAQGNHDWASFIVRIDFVHGLFGINPTNNQNEHFLTNEEAREFFVDFDKAFFHEISF